MKHYFQIVEPRQPKKAKKIYLDLSNYFSLHTKKLISSENDKRIGITVSIMYKDQINVSYVMNLYKDVEDGLILISKGIIDQIIKIYMHMQLEYVRSKNKPQIDMEFVSNVVKKSFPGTLIHLKKLPMKPTKISSEDVLTLKEMQCVEELKRVLAITKKVYNKESIANAIKKAAKKTKNMSVQDIVTDAYQILLKSPSDERRQKPAVKKKIDHEKEKDELLKTVKNL